MVHENNFQNGSNPPNSFFGMAQGDSPDQAVFTRRETSGAHHDAEAREGSGQRIQAAGGCLVGRSVGWQRLDGLISSWSCFVFGKRFIHKWLSEGAVVF